MRICRKCEREVDDDSRICRRCGSILDEVPAPVTPLLKPVQEGLPVDPRSDENPITLPIESNAVSTGQDIDCRHWTCMTCGEQIEFNFENCWNCGTASDGTIDSDFVRDQEVSEPLTFEKVPLESVLPIISCSKCGSSKIIPRVEILDQSEGKTGRITCMVVGNPNALIFRDRMYGEIRADICGDCGHVELRVEDALKLYEHYSKPR